MVSFIVIGIFFEAIPNNESIDPIFKGHILRLIIVKKRVSRRFFTFLQETRFRYVLSIPIKLCNYNYEV